MSCKVNIALFDTLLPSAPAITDCLEVFSEEELEQYHRLISPVQQLNFATGRLYLRQTLSQASGLPAKEIQIKKTENGKPWCPQIPEVCFSVSHTNHYVTVATTTNSCELGIDIEKQSRKPGVEQLAEKHCHPIEQQQLKFSHNQARHMMALWTLKESLIKMKGEKISQLSLNSFAFTINETIAYLPPENMAKENCCFFLFSIDDLFLSLACNTTSAELEFRKGNMDNEPTCLLAKS